MPIKAAPLRLLESREHVVQKKEENAAPKKISSDHALEKRTVSSDTPAQITQ